MKRALLMPSLSVLVLAGAATGQAGGIEVFAGETLFARGTRVSATHIYRSKGDYRSGTHSASDSLDRSFHEHRLVVGVDHGIRHDLTLSALVPFVDKSFDSDAGDVDTSGLGDVALLAKYRAYQHLWERSALNIAVIAGVETPSGETSERSHGERAAPELQPGTGSWDPFAAVSATLDLDRFRADVVAFYKDNSEGTQDFEDSDFFSLELDAGYRFLHTKYPGPTASAKVGLQWRHKWRAHLDGDRIDDSGLDELLLRGGVTWHPAPNSTIKLAADFPVYQDVDGEQLALDFRTFLAVGLRF